MLGKFRKSLRLDKNTISKNVEPDHGSPYCHACGQYTPNSPNRRNFGSFSTRSGDRVSWAGFSTSDSGYESLDGGYAQASDCQADDDRSQISMKAPNRQQTYSSSVYSSDIPAVEVLEPFPMMEDLPEEEDADAEQRRSRSPSLHPWGACENPRMLQPPKSRYARLNELPAASPRALMFPDDIFDMTAGIQEQDSKEKPGHKRGRWGSKGSFSFVGLPTRIRKLSRASLPDH